MISILFAVLTWTFVQ